MKNILAKTLLIASVALSGCGGGGDEPVKGGSIIGDPDSTSSVFSVHHQGSLVNNLQAVGWQDDNQQLTSYMANNTSKQVLELTTPPTAGASAPWGWGAGVVAQSAQTNSGVSPRVAKSDTPDLSGFENGYLIFEARGTTTTPVTIGFQTGTTETDDDGQLVDTKRPSTSNGVVFNTTDAMQSSTVGEYATSRTITGEWQTFRVALKDLINGKAIDFTDVGSPFYIQGEIDDGGILEFRNIFFTKDGKGKVGDDIDGGGDGGSPISDDATSTIYFEGMLEQQLTAVGWEATSFLGADPDTQTLVLTPPPQGGTIKEWGWGAGLVVPQGANGLDLSGFKDGYLNFDIKGTVTTDVTIGFQTGVFDSTERPPSSNGVLFDANDGSITSTWQSYQIPISDLLNGKFVDMTDVTSPLYFQGGEEDSGTIEVRNVFYSVTQEGVIGSDLNGGGGDGGDGGDGGNGGGTDGGTGGGSSSSDYAVAPDIAPQPAPTGNFPVSSVAGGVAPGQPVLGTAELTAISYGAFRAEERSNTYAPSVEEIKEDLKIMHAAGIRMLRTYNTRDFIDTERLLQAISELQQEDANFEMNVMLGVWISALNAFSGSAH